MPSISSILLCLFLTFTSTISALPAVNATRTDTVPVPGTDLSLQLIDSQNRDIWTLNQIGLAFEDLLTQIRRFRPSAQVTKPYTGAVPGVVELSLVPALGESLTIGSADAAIQAFFKVIGDRHWYHKASSRLLLSSGDAIALLDLGRSYAMPGAGANETAVFA